MSVHPATASGSSASPATTRTSDPNSYINRLPAIFGRTRAYFTVNHSRTGTLSFYKIALGVGVIAGTTLIVISLLAFKGLMLVALASSFKCAILIGGLTLTAACYSTLIALRYPQHSGGSTPPPQIVLYYLENPNNIDRLIPVEDIGNRPFPENALLSSDRYILREHHLQDLGFLQTNIGEAQEATLSEVNEFLNRIDLLPDSYPNTWRGQANRLLHRAFNRYTREDRRPRFRRIFRQIIKTFKTRYDNFANMTPEERRDLHDDIHRFLRRGNQIFSYCEDHEHVVFDDFYNEFVECDPNYMSRMEFGNLVRSFLYNKRRDIFNRTVERFSGGHDANTLNLHRRLYSRRYGLRADITSSSNIDLTYASTRAGYGSSIENQIQRAFENQYTKDQIIDDLLAVINNPRSEQQNLSSSRGSLTKEKLTAWIGDHYEIDFAEAEEIERVFNGTDYKREVIVLLLRDLGIIQRIE